MWILAKNSPGVLGEKSPTGSNLTAHTPFAASGLSILAPVDCVWLWASVKVTSARPTRSETASASPRSDLWNFAIITKPLFHLIFVLQNSSQTWAPGRGGQTLPKAL